MSKIITKKFLIIYKAYKYIFTRIIIILQYECKVLKCNLLKNCNKNLIYLKKPLIEVTQLYFNLMHNFNDIYRIIGNCIPWFLT